MTERPKWCEHIDCVRLLTVGESAACCGRLPNPEDHAGTDNTHRMCLHGAEDDGGWTFDLKLNTADVFHMNRLFRAIREDNARVQEDGQ